MGPPTPAACRAAKCTRQPTASSTWSIDLAASHMAVNPGGEPTWTQLPPAFALPPDTSHNVTPALLWAWLLVHLRHPSLHHHCSAVAPEPMQVLACNPPEPHQERQYCCVCAFNTSTLRGARWPPSCHHVIMPFARSGPEAPFSSLSASACCQQGSHINIFPQQQQNSTH
jgi:hypothetical protein